MIRWLFRETDNVWLIFIRVAFGLLALIEACIQFFYYHLHKKAFDTSYFQFNYIGFEWLEPLPEPFMSLFFILLIASAASIMLGWQYRMTMLFYAVGISYIFLLEKSHYLNHGYLLCLLSFVMVVLPAHKRFSLDMLKRRVEHRVTCLNYERWILPFTMGIVYFFGGIAKLNPDWLRAQPLKLWMEYKARTHFLGDILKAEFIPWFLAYGGLIFDLSITFLLLGKRTRIPAFFAVLFFHFTNFIIFEIGIFPWFSIALSLSFFPSEKFWQGLTWVQRKVPVILNINTRYSALRQKMAGTITRTTVPESQKRKWITVGLTIYLIYHIVMPLRHYYFPGDVAWTEEGHRYAWRMMLRSKAGYGTFVVESVDGQKDRVKPSEYLRGKQVRKLYTHPDMIWQFAKYLQVVYEEKGWEKVTVHADIRVKLNDGSYYRYIDPSVDLASEKWKFFKPSHWILPERAMQ